MTVTKMIRILSSYEDCPLFEIKDSAKYDFETDTYPCPVREIILLSDIIEQFKNGIGDFFEEFKVTSNFKDLIKLIESGNVSKTPRFKLYDDSKQEMLDNWSKYHPDETYEQVMKRKFDKTNKKAHTLLANIAAISSAALNY